MANIGKNSSLAEQAADSTHRMADRISDTAHRVAQELERAAIRLKNAEQQWAGSSSGYIRDHPLRVTGIALATGFLASQLLGWYRASRAASAENELTPPS